LGKPANKIISVFGYLFLAFILLVLYMWILHEHLMEFAYDGDGDYAVATFAPFVYSYELQLPDLDLGKESAYKWRMKHISANNTAHVSLWASSERELPLLGLQTHVSIPLLDSKGSVVLGTSGLLSDRTAWLGGRPWDVQVLRNHEIWTISSGYPGPEIKWSEEYLLIVKITNPDKRAVGVKAHMEVASGPK